MPGVTASWPYGATESVALRVVLPVPLVVFVNVIVPEKFPAASALAEAFTVAMSVVLAPAASVPPVLEMSSHAAVFAAVQLTEAMPEFVMVYVRLFGANGPPRYPDAASG